MLDSNKVLVIKLSKNSSKLFMVGAASFRQRITRPIAGFTMLAMTAIAVPNPGMAQTPTFQGNTSAPSSFNSNTARGEDAYTLGGGDRLRLDIFNVPEYSGEYQVLVDGSLNLPIVGSTRVQGMTLKQATEVISNKFAPFLRRPIVTISLLATRPLKVAVAGEVNRPGAYTIPLTAGGAAAGGTAIAFPTVTQVLQLAGGTTKVADVRQVVIRRVAGRDQTINVNLWDLFQGGNLAQDITLRDGDTVYIPASSTVNYAEARQLASATFAGQNQPVKIAVVGEVNRPGTYTLVATAENVNNTNITNNNPNIPNAPTLTKALQVAGGITPIADIRQVKVRRSTRAGSEQQIDVNLWQLLQGGDLNQDLLLQEGDTIVVPTATALNTAETARLATASFSPDKITVNVVGEVPKPGAVELPPNTPLNQAILAAGGFNNRARKRTVELIRLNPDGTVAKRNISIDFKRGSSDQNPAMRSGDVIVVGRSGLAQVSDTLGSVLSPVGGLFSVFNFFRIFSGGD